MKASLSLGFPFRGQKKGRIGFLMDGLMILKSTSSYMEKNQSLCFPKVLENGETELIFSYVFYTMGLNHLCT